MTAQQRAWSWGIGLAVFLVLLYLLRGVMLPFVAGMAVAYFLDPACDWLEEKGSSRLFATGIITAGFFLVALLLLVLTAPLLYGQLVALLQSLPEFFREIVNKIRPLLDALGPYIGADSTNIGDKMSAYVADALKWIARILLGVLAQLEALANLLSLLIITPIVSFYLLHDWDHIVARVDKLLPRAHAETIREQLRLIDQTLAGFLRGQVTVCLILGAFYGIALSIVGLPFGFVIGLATGLISFVPFFGMLLGFVIGMAVAVASFDTLLPVGLVAGIFAVGQIVEGNFLTPKMVGERVGLHPVWVIFGLLAGGALFGFIGVLLAVPMAAVIGVLVRFAVARYLESPLYLHGAPEEPGPAEGDGDEPS